MSTFTGRVMYGPDTFLGVVSMKTGTKLTTFKGGVPAAQFSAREAEAIVEHLDIVGEYSEDAEVLAKQGITLAQFAQSKFNEEFGAPMVGMPSNMRPELKSAFEKQSELFAQRYGDGQQR